MRMTTGIVIVLMSWAVVGACGVGRAAEPVEDLRLVASAPTHLQVDWQGQAAAYRIVYSQAIESRQHITSVVAQGPFTLVDLVPETEYVLRVQALESGPEGDAFKVIGESQALQVTTEPWQPRQWENLLLWPSRHVNTFAGGTAHPAIVAHGDELLIVECYEGAIYASQVSPENLEVEWTKVLVPAKEYERPVRLDSVIIEDILWVAWVNLSPPSRFSSVLLPTQTLLTYNLHSDTVGDPIELHQAPDIGLAAFNGQPWVLGPGDGETGVTVASYDPTGGLREPRSGIGGANVRVREVAGLDLGAEAFLAFLQHPVGPGHAVRRALWSLKFNGQEFYEQRMLRGRGAYSSPTGAVVNSAIVLAYGKATQEELSDIDLTLTSAEGGEVTSTSYIRDGTYNITPDAVAVGDTIYIVYNKWSARAGSPNCVNYGTFIGKIQLKF